MREVKFGRLSVSSEVFITSALQALMRDGWRVVSHAENDSEYSFVLERDR